MDTLKVEVLDLCGLYPVMEAIHLPHSTEIHRSMRFYYDPTQFEEWNDSYTFTYNYKDSIDKGDVVLASRLMRAGDQHAKALRGIMVYLRITAPIYWFTEFETYNVGRTRLSSTSTMHTDCKGLTGEDLQKAKAEIPMGKMRTTVDVLSYQALRRIYYQRRNHRLPEWRTFCHFIETLPLADKLIIGPFEPKE